MFIFFKSVKKVTLRYLALIVAILVGILILIFPPIMNYLIAIYLILIGALKLIEMY